MPLMVMEGKRLWVLMEHGCMVARTLHGKYLRCCSHEVVT